MNSSEQKEDQFLKSVFQNDYKTQTELGATFTDNVMKSLHQHIYTKPQTFGGVLWVLIGGLALIFIGLPALLIVLKPGLPLYLIPGILQKYEWIPFTLLILFYIHICRTLVFLAIFALRNRMKLNFG